MSQETIETQEISAYLPTPSGRRIPIEKEEMAVGRPIGMLTPELVDSLEEQVKLLRRARTALLQLTDQDDWQDFQGKAYLTDSGVHKVAFAAGVEFGKPEPVAHEGKDEDGSKWISFTCAISATCRGRTIHEEGSSSTKDPFFAMANGKQRHFDKIDIQSVRKKSITNGQHRCLTKILGLSGLRWEQLEEAGISRAGSRATKFKGKTRSDGSGRWSTQKEELQNMLLEMNKGDVDLVSGIIGESFPGKKEIIELTDRQVADILPAVKAQYEEPAPAPATKSTPRPTPAKTAEKPTVDDFQPPTANLKHRKAKCVTLMAEARRLGVEVGRTVDEVHAMDEPDFVEFEEWLEEQVREARGK